MINEEQIKIIEEYIGKQLRAKRIKRGLTLSSVASKVGISHQQVQKYEQAQSRISAAMLFKFAEVYGIDINQFFKDVKKMAQKESPSKRNIIDCESPKDSINLLIIEDNPGDEAILRKALESFPKLNIFCVHDGIQTIELLRYKTLCPESPKPDLIFLDLSLPKKDGLSLLRDLKRDREIQEIPVIILTNNLSTDKMVESYKFGASGYICKSFDYEVFKKNITDCVKYWKNTVILPSYS